MTVDNLPEYIKTKIAINEAGCWLWTGNIAAGYAKARRKRVHRVVYELLHGPITLELVCDHTCGIKHCVNPEHIEVVAQATNVRRGLSTTLTPDNLQTINNLRMAQTPMHIIAKHLGVSRNCIRQYLQGATWKELPRPEGLKHIDTRKRTEAAEARITEMKALRQTGWTQQAIANKFGITQGAVSLLLRGIKR